MTDTPTLTLDVLPTEFGPPALTLIRLNDGRFAATKRFPVDLTKAEVTFDTDRKRVRLEFPTQWVNFTTIEQVTEDMKARREYKAAPPGPWRDAETSGHMVGQAANVIVAMANGAVPSNEIQRALTYFAGGVYSPDFLPFPRTPLTLPPDGDASDRHTAISPGEKFVQQPAKSASESFDRMERLEHRIQEVLISRHGADLDGIRGTASRLAREICDELVTYAYPGPRALEASEPLTGLGPDAKADLALTCLWPNGAETVEFVSRKAADVLCPGQGFADDLPEGL